MRNTFLQELRQSFRASNSRIFFGRTRVMQAALGRTPETAHQPSLDELTKHMSGDVGLLMTDESPEKVTEFINNYVQMDYARAGLVSPVELVVPAGIVYSRGGQIPEEDDVPLAHSLETMVRSLGMPTTLKNGKVTLDSEYRVCKVGEVLNGKQTRLLKLFGVACSEFKVDLVAYYDKEKETVVVQEKNEDAMEA